MISPTNQPGYNLLGALGFVSCDFFYKTGSTICYGHWVLHLVLSHSRQGYDLIRALGSAISHTRQGVRFVTGIGFCVMRYHTRDRGYDLLRTLGSASCDLAYESARVQFVRGWARHLVNRTRNNGYDLLRALGSASCHITHETGATIC